MHCALGTLKVIMVAVAAKVSEATATIAKVNSLGYSMWISFLIFRHCIHSYTQT